MMKKILIAAIVAVTAAMIAAPALAQGYGMGAGMGSYGAGAGACGCGVSYGAPQDCVATVSCNIPVTQMVPYQTTTTEMQTVNYPVCVPQQSSVTVPKMVCVPEEVPVTTYTTACAQTQVPVEVPTTAYQPCTTMMPQTKTMCLSGADMTSMMGSSGSCSPCAGMGAGTSGYSAGAPASSGMAY